MSRFNDFTRTVIAGVPDLARDTLGDFPQAATQDANAFLTEARKDLKRWTKLLAQGKINQQDFTDLVEAKRALAEIHALTQTGIALARLERFRTGLIDLVVNTAFDVFL
jgi:hypothetical protein